jgi:hypothetical protein
MDNTELKAQADLLVQRCRLAELLEGYAGWSIGGSYSYDLMCWRDLDIYILDPRFDLKRCFEVGYKLTQRLGARKLRFTNNVGDEPNGFYWGIKLGDERKGAWKLDLWFLDRVGYDAHADYTRRLRERLTPETRSAILLIKEAYWRRPEFRVAITSDMIYRAVLDHGIAVVGDFERFVKEQAR